MHTCVCELKFITSASGGTDLELTRHVSLVTLLLLLSLAGTEVVCLTKLTVGVPAK